MGAWSSENFGNDTAADWAAGFVESPGLAMIESTIGQVLGEDDYLDADFGSECVAACDALARMRGQWGTRDAYTEELDAWIEANPTDVPDALRKRALQALDRVTGDDSELAELWEDDDEWLGEIAKLKTRLGG